MSKVWINGRLIDKSDAKVSLFDHGFLHGDGVWEALRVFNGALFRAEEHLECLFASASVFEITVPLTQSELIAAIHDTLRANSRTEGYVRVIVSRGPGTLGPDPRKIDPQVFIIAEEYQPFPPELYETGLNAVTACYPINVANPAYCVRTLARLDIVLAKQFALRSGCLEALLRTEEGGIIGATEGEVFFARNGTLYPVPPSSSIESQAILELARTVVPVASADSNRLSDPHAADEVFVVGTACGVIAIVRLDGRDIGEGTEGPVTRQLRERYRVLTRGSG